MSDHNDGGPAFPLGTSSNSEAEHMMAVGTGGMSLRDWFAGQALAGIEAASAHPDVDLTIDPDFDMTASYCYRMADAMLAAREEKR